MGISPEYFLDRMSFDEINELFMAKSGIRKGQKLPEIKITEEQHKAKIKGAEKWLKGLK
jgi:hypothetical protein